MPWWRFLGDGRDGPHSRPLGDFGREPTLLDWFQFRQRLFQRIGVGARDLSHEENERKVDLDNPRRSTRHGRGQACRQDLQRPQANRVWLSRPPKVLLQQNCCESWDCLCRGNRKRSILANSPRAFRLIWMERRERYVGVLRQTANASRRLRGSNGLDRDGADRALLEWLAALSDRNRFHVGCGPALVEWKIPEWAFVKNTAYQSEENSNA